MERGWKVWKTKQIFINKLCRLHDLSERYKKRYARHKRVVKMIDGVLLLFKCHSMFYLCFNKIQRSRAHNFATNKQLGSYALTAQISRKVKAYYIESKCMSCCFFLHKQINFIDELLSLGKYVVCFCYVTLHSCLMCTEV